MMTELENTTHCISMSCMVCIFFSSKTITNLIQSTNTSLMKYGCVWLGNDYRLLIIYLETNVLHSYFAGFSGVVKVELASTFSFHHH